MSASKLRDRDAIVAREGLIFRVLGYSHPSNSYICDVEYAPASTFRSKNPKAPRGMKHITHYKFYEDEGWKFLSTKFPRYLVFDESLQRKVIGVNQDDIRETLEPQDQLEKILGLKQKDSLQNAMQNALSYIAQDSNLNARNLGIFGSMLHGFHNPKFSDIDFTVYGRVNLRELQDALKEFYGKADSPFRNEFESDDPVKLKRWHFSGFSPKEYAWHQKRKLIYALFSDKETGRVVKTEFEPIKEWKEIAKESRPETRIRLKGWVKMTARIVDDSDAAFMPSVYGVKPLKVLEGHMVAYEVVRIVSYMEEFRLQAFKDETVLVEGNLEEAQSAGKTTWQIALTYCPGYYEQVLKLARQA